MGIEITVNIALLCFCIFSFFYAGVGVTPPAIPGTLSASAWPRVILAGLIVALFFNIRACRASRSAPDAKSEIAIAEFFPPKFVKSALLLIAYSIVLNYLGFITSTVIFFALFSYIIGLRKISSLIAGSVVATIVIYVVFQIFLQVMLPRGVWIFRDFAIWLEILAL
ncbi:MAG: tripartite tricarboxylate transporter TctB family protein [Synergistaceae bacterium]|jgi:hypothetical protein|nr:tripartite tricarboxylate transporter TctB family protein [Synergistaceae bacterium]